MNKWLQDVESRGKLAFNSGAIKSYKDAEEHVRKTYQVVIERECFVAGWNTAFWDEQSRVLKAVQDALK